MLVELGEIVIFLFIIICYEILGGVIEIIIERRVIFSLEIFGKRIGEVCFEWEVFMDLVKLVCLELVEKLDFKNIGEIC